MADDRTISDMQRIERKIDENQEHNRQGHAEIRDRLRALELQVATMEARNPTNGRRRDAALVTTGTLGGGGAMVGLWELIQKLFGDGPP